MSNPYFRKRKFVLWFQLVSKLVSQLVSKAISQLFSYSASQFVSLFFVCSVSLMHYIILADFPTLSSGLQASANQIQFTVLVAVNIVCFSFTPCAVWFRSFHITILSAAPRPVKRRQFRCQWHLHRRQAALQNLHRLCSFLIKSQRKEMTSSTGMTSLQNV